MFDPGHIMKQLPRSGYHSTPLLTKKEDEEEEEEEEDEVLKHKISSKLQSQIQSHIQIQIHIQLNLSYMQASRWHVNVCPFLMYNTIVNEMIWQGRRKRGREVPVRTVRLGILQAGEIGR